MKAFYSCVPINTGGDKMSKLFAILSTSSHFTLNYLLLMSLWYLLYTTKPQLFNY